MRATFMSTSDRLSGPQLERRWEVETPALSGCMHLTMLVMVPILLIYVHLNYVNYKNPETDDCKWRVQKITL